MIEIHNFTKKYDNFVAVHDLSLTINKGDIFGFIGLILSLIILLLIKRKNKIMKR